MYRIFLNSLNKNAIVVIIIVLFGIGILIGLYNNSIQEENNSIINNKKERRAPKEFHVDAVSKSVFKPAMLNIQVGDTVTWTNIDSEVHTVSSANVTSDGGVYFHKTLLPDETYSVTFDKSGTYFYSCLIKFHGMSGIIRVS